MSQMGEKKSAGKYGVSLRLVIQDLKTMRKGQPLQSNEFDDVRKGQPLQSNEFDDPGIFDDPQYVESFNNLFLHGG